MKRGTTMKFRECRIVFLGTPDFAVAVLKKMVEEKQKVVGVVTAPDKPAGRGMQLSQSAVKQFAVAHDLSVLQPVKLKDESFLSDLRALKADVQVVVAFRMLPEQVWNMPPLGTINLHASLLPRYRGAAPINWAIINGERETGITTFRLQHAIDTGDVLKRMSLSIGDQETAGELHDRMKDLGAELVVETLREYCEGRLQSVPQSAIQDYTDLPSAPKLYTETCRIDWSCSAEQIFNLIRGLSPYPAAFTELNGKTFKIFQASIDYSDAVPAPGTVMSDGKHYLKFAAQNGWVNCREVQLEGKKRMSILDFLRGYRFTSSE